MSSERTQNVSSATYSSPPSVRIRSSQNARSVPSSALTQQRQSQAATDDDSMPSLSARSVDSDYEDDATNTLEQTLLEPLLEHVGSLPAGGRVVVEVASSPPLVSPGAVQDVPLPPLPRPGARGGGESDAESLPSLQTVSDSSDDGWTDEEGEEDEESDEDEEEEEGGDEEDEPENDSAFNSLPHLGPASLPRGAVRLMHTLTRAVAEAGEGWVGMDFGGVDQNGDTYILGGPGSDSVRRMFSSQTEDSRNFGTDIMFSTMRQVLDALGSPAVPEHDPKRAQTILKALEIVPEDLVRRYEKLRAGQEGEESEGCAVCRESFLDPTAYETTVAVQFTELPYPGSDDSSSIETPSILAFPCPGMHLFHSHCISPWLGRKTTCPTCRFDVDPDSLTLTFLRDIRQRSNHPLADKQWSPPPRRSFKRWLEREERKLGGESVSDFESDVVEECANDFTDDESDDLPPLDADQFATGNSASIPAMFQSNLPGAEPPRDVASFYNIDPITRESMLAALLPIMDMTIDPTGSFTPPGGDEESEDEWEDDEDDDALPPLISSGHGPVASSTQFQGSAPHSGDGAVTELPPLINTTIYASSGPAQPGPPSWPPYENDDENDELPILVPVRPRATPSRPAVVTDEDDLPDLVDEPPSQVSMEDID
ncbi:uncharacterized protein PHACADRAFT_187378 [Phanerochaete carnosa HHB-10118-sp]|uniref:RING-type domain-containing protein n=1 Tax=Phanerochaete carnosa (strain HHB-10118-sp) TaxID=650164 RepID=K5UQA6_PHACS|nr:uncharacterized protein PHACADRAFT_187378 [Phanerochaete carnosa HHB-10118-sp]EKM52006.1 hypothetical protein PHACADRAFT_187378 [Phanerochaete carnosa HHB-10118-sp]